MASWAHYWLMFNWMSSSTPKPFSAGQISSHSSPSPYHCIGFLLPMYSTWHLTLLNAMGHGQQSNLSRSFCKSLPTLKQINTPTHFDAIWKYLLCPWDDSFNLVPIVYLIQRRLNRNKAREHLHINNDHVGAIALPCVTETTECPVSLDCVKGSKSHFLFLASYNWSESHALTDWLVRETMGRPLVWRGQVCAGTICANTRGITRPFGISLIGWYQQLSPAQISSWFMTLSKTEYTQQSAWHVLSTVQMVCW